MNELSKLYILELKKIAALNDSEFMYVGNDYSSFEEELNVPLTEEEKKEIGLDFDLKNEAFLFADPTQPLNHIKKELDIYKGYYRTRDIDKTKEIFEKKIDPQQLDLIKKPLIVLPTELLTSKLEKIKQEGELDSDVMDTAYELQSKLISAESLFEILSELYLLGTDFGRLQGIIELYKQIFNPRLQDNPMILERFKGEILNAIFIAYSAAKAKPTVSDSRIKTLESKIKIRQSDIFDYLKPIDVESTPEVLDERDVLMEKTVQVRDEHSDQPIKLEPKYKIKQEEPTAVTVINENLAKKSTVSIFNLFLKSALILQDI